MPLELVRSPVECSGRAGPTIPSPVPFGGGCSQSSVSAFSPVPPEAWSWKVFASDSAGDGKFLFAKVPAFLSSDMRNADPILSDSIFLDLGIDVVGAKIKQHFQSLQQSPSRQ